MKPLVTHPIPEDELIARCRRGQAAAWNELFERHYDAVGRFVFQYSPDFTREDVEEIGQEVFLSVVRHIDSFRGASAFQTWLYRLAINKARDFLEHRNAAKRGRGQRPLSLDAADPQTGAVLDPPQSAPDPAETMVRHEDRLLLRQAIDRLSDPCREIIELRYFGDLSYEALAAALHLHPKTVSSRLSKCLDRLEALARQVFAGENSRSVSV